MSCILVMNVFMCYKKISMNYSLKYFIANARILIVIFHVSTPEHVEGQPIQDEARQEDEVHDVAPSGKEHHSNVIFY
jgi:hypothetical protein